ncbi:hypothetical protein SAMN05421675_0027 [Pasteurella multocida]|uniref:hypothetical protein n=1 Tax=Pasteurella multocida TaxID=747 RepID=UPI0008F2A31B|nr:hypothetical protein [Pasteurella multocida]SFO69122.1 hypothetical protein SAMN05421675_0027 [Pasteurella multocida]VEE38233.1 Uncharacterised protein [Pasteurella multocida subsp. gallicida]
MKIFIQNGIVILFLLEIISCTPQMTRDFWNGVYSVRVVTEEYNRKRDAFYAKETSEQKELRKENTEICLTISGGKKESKKTWSEDIFLKCMEERESTVP